MTRGAAAANRTVRRGWAGSARTERTSCPSTATVPLGGATAGGPLEWGGGTQMSHMGLT